MKTSVLRRGRLAYWVVPLAILGMSVAFQACGDDEDSCGDNEVLPSLAACEEYAAEFDCSGSSFNDETSICTVTGCVCEFVIDDIDDF